ncbi:MAG: recombinase family protein, partial [Acidimicrobiales bacterium]
MSKAAIYARVSVDRDQDKATIERQEADCRALAEAKGFDEFEPFIDRNLSAFKRGVIRPAYEDMKARVAEGEFKAVFAYRLDRLSRSLAEALKLIDHLDKHGTGLVMVNGDVDTTTSTGRAFFQMSAVFAEFEAGSTRDRLKSYNKDAAAKGQMKTGGRRCYGYEYNGTVKPEEVAYIR